MAGRGFSISVEGLAEMGANIERMAYPGLRNAIRASLRGKGGEALVSEMKARAPRRSGGLVSGIGVHGDAAAGDDVLVGYQGGLSGGNKGGGRFQLGAWVESGVEPHEIHAAPGHALAFNGREYQKVKHPGQRGQRVAAKSIKAAEWEVLADVVDELNRLDGAA